ncbi:hypothetical protein, partial [Mycobacterium sp.]|uniref:hypothetical protein n=1 Tax=Mycobacterium sp. TaxID=1785 RepID=UPI003F9A0EBD
QLRRSLVLTRGCRTRHPVFDGTIAWLQTRVTLVTPPSTVLSLRRGFTYINIRNRDNPRFEAQAALDSAVKKGARIHVSPMFTYPPKSELIFIASYNLSTAPEN